MIKRGTLNLSNAVVNSDGTITISKKGDVKPKQKTIYDILKEIKQ